MSTLEERAAPRARAPQVRPGPGAAPSIARLARAVPWPIVLVTGIAAVLRFAQLSAVSPNEFYDAAVRSMSLSLHNFFFGAFDPGAVMSIDKPPLDLWLQVVSVKVLGWNQFALKLPEALGGTLAIPLLYDAVRRVLGRPAALGAAIALAVLPESVLTARSDTMDSVMMLLVVAALWLTIRATQDAKRRRWPVLAGVALGLAFNVKLSQALLAAPALVALYLIAADGIRREKLRRLAAAGGALLVAGLAWPLAVTLAPGSHPWAVGSSDGTIWNAMFVFNGIGKITHASASTKPGGPGLFRLVVSTGWHYDLLFGCALVAALAVGAAGALVARRRRARPGSLERAFGICIAIWLGLGLIVFDVMSTVHARYLEAVSPAVAVAIGYGAAVLAGLVDRRAARSRPAILATAVALGCSCAYTLGLKSSLAWGAAALIIATAGAGLVARAPGRLGEASRWLTAGLIVTCVLVFPVHESFELVRSNANDSLGLAVAPNASTTALSRYLGPRTAGLRYELAVDEPLSLAPLLISDRRPILPLTSFGGRPLVGLDRLLAEVRAGRLRYGLVAASGCGPAAAHWAACTPAARWVRRTGVDVSAAAGLTGPSRLYLLDAGTGLG